MPLIRPALARVLYLFVAAAVAVAYGAAHPWPPLGSAIKDGFWTFLVTLSAFGAGYPAGIRLLPVCLTQLERALFSLLLGWLLWIGVMIALGLVGGWTPWVVRGLAIGGAISGLRWATAFIAPGRHFRSLWTAWAAGLFLLALAPVTFYDSLVYHFALPELYVQTGGWTVPRDLIYSAFPQNLEMLLTAGLLLNGEGTANLISAQLALFLPLLVYAAGVRFFSDQTAKAALALLAAMPAYWLLSSGGYVDIPLAVFFFGSAYLVVLCRTESSVRTAAAAGLLAGAAMGTKYTGAIAIAIGFLALWPRKASMAAFLAGAGMMFLPWAVKNGIAFGNPVFPFLYKYGIQARNPWLEGAAAGYFAGLTEYTPRSLLDLPALLWDMAINSFSFGRGMDVLGDAGWTPFLLLVPLAWRWRHHSAARVLGAYALVFFSVWALTRPVLRFLMPIVPLLALFAGAGWSEAARQSPRFQTLLTGSLGVVVLFQTLTFVQILDITRLHAVPLGLETRDVYLSRHVRHSYWRAAQFINSETPADARVLIAGDQRSYYYQRLVTPSTVFQDNRFIAMANSAPSSAALRNALRSQWTHLVINKPEWERLLPYKTLSLSGEGERHWREMLSSLERLYADSSCEVYAL